MCDVYCGASLLRLMGMRCWIVTRTEAPSECEPAEPARA